MSTLYLRYPAKASETALCSFALVGPSGNLLQQGAAALADLQAPLAAAQRVVLLLAGTDVTLVRVACPPLSRARLMAALPNLVEEHILGDPADCILSAGAPGPDGVRSVAVAQRSWLMTLVKTLLAHGARNLTVLPAQLCLPLTAGVTAALEPQGSALELTMRLAPQEGLGLMLAGAGAEPAAALDMLRGFAADAPLTLYLPAPALAQWQALEAPGITLEAAQWSHWIAGAATAGLDLAPALGSAGTQARNWQRWRWPLRLALLVALVNIAAINIEWLGLKRTANSVRAGMLHTFKTVYPNEAPLLPAAQMRRHIALANLAGGQVGSDEFTALSAALGDAMGPLASKGVIAALDYRERTLSVKLKPDLVDAAALAQVRTALTARNLVLSEPAPGSWQIRAGTK